MKKTARNDGDIISGRVMGNTLSDFSQRIAKNGKTIPPFLGKSYEVGLRKTKPNDNRSRHSKNVGFRFTQPNLPDSFIRSHTKGMKIKLVVWVQKLISDTVSKIIILAMNNAPLVL